jgi:hypothetical protein
MAEQWVAIMNWDRGLTANVWDLYDGEERVGKVIRQRAEVQFRGKTIGYLAGYPGNFEVQFRGEIIGYRPDIEAAKQLLESAVRAKLKGL